MNGNIDLDSLDDEYLCKICQSIMLEPMVLKICNHTMCNNCVKAISGNADNKKYFLIF